MQGSARTILFFCILLFGLTAILLGQDANFDLWSYHFYNGYAFLHNRLGWDVAPAGEQSFLNPCFDIINYLLLATQQPMTASFMLGAISGLNCFVVYKTALLFFRDQTPAKQFFYALISTVIGVTGAAGIGLIGTTTNDTKMALLILLAFYFLMKALFEPNPSRQLKLIMISGFIMGLDVGFKLVAACYAMGLIAALLVAKPWNRRHLFHCGVLLMCMGAGFLLADGWWMVFLYKHFHNPIFPYYNNIFHSPYAVQSSYSDPRYYPQHFLTLPFLLASYNMLISDAPIREMRFAVVYVLMVLLLIQCIFQKKSSIINSRIAPLFFFFLTSYLVWFFEFTIYRYVLPLELLSGLLIVCMLRMLLEKASYAHILMLILVISVAMNTIVLNWGRTQVAKPYFNVSAPPLPPDSVVLMVAVPLAFVIPYFQHDVHFIGMPYFLRSSKLAGVDHPVTMGLRDKLQTEWVDPIIRAADGKNIFSLSFKFKEIDLGGNTPKPFFSKYLLKKSDHVWKLFFLALKGKNIVAEEVEVNEIPGLTELLASFPPDRVETQLTDEEKKSIDALIASFNKINPYHEAYNATARMVLYQYGLVRDANKCISLNEILEICAMKKIHAPVISKTGEVSWAAVSQFISLPANI